MVSNNFEGGSHTTAITTGNSGGASGDAFDAVTITADGAITFDNTFAALGQLAGKFVTVSSGRAFCEHNLTAAAEGWGRIYYYHEGNPATGLYLGGAYSAGSLLGNFRITTASKITLSTGGVASGTSTMSLTSATVYRLEFHWKVTSGTTGDWELRIYQGDSWDILETVLLSGVALGVSTADSVRYGQVVNSVSLTCYLDNVGHSATGWMGPQLGTAFRSGASANIGATRQTSLTVSKPTGTLDGDVMVAYITSNNATVVVTPPAGWIECSGSPLQSADGATLAAFTKVASGEGANYSFSVGATTRSICGWIGSYTGVASVASVQTTSTTTVGIPNSTTTVPGVSVGAATSYAVLCTSLSGGNGVTATSTHPSWTERVDQATSVTTATENCQAVYDSAVGTGSTGNQVVTHTPGSLSAHAGFMLILRPQDLPWAPQTNAPETLRTVSTGLRW